MKQKIYNNLELITDIILCFFIIIMFVIYNGKSSIIYMISLAMLLLVTFVNFIKNRKLLIDKKVIWMLIFPLLGLISFFWADNKQNVMSVLLILVGNEIITYCIMLLIYYKNKKMNIQ